jgi:hypothetical protein
MLDIFQKWKDRIFAFVDTKVRGVQLELIERVTGIMSYLLYAITLMFVIFGFFLFIGFGMAEWFTAMLESRIGGFFMAAAFYLVLALIFVAARRPLLRKLSDIFVNLLTARRDDDDNDDDDQETVKAKGNQHE